MTTSNQQPASCLLHPASCILLFVAVFALYAITAAPGLLFGDPSEYQFIPAILGIAHPPGYAFYTLLAKLWQTLVPVGTIALRTNLLAAAAGAWVVTVVYLATREIGTAVNWNIGKLENSAGQPTNLPVYQSTSIIAFLWGALCLAASTTSGSTPSTPTLTS